MAMFEFICPRCHRACTVGPLGTCQNILDSGRACDFEFAIEMEDGNRTYKVKYLKHTNPPAGMPADGAYSWVANSGEYAINQQHLLMSDSLYLDPKNNYLFLWATPSGAQPIAKVIYADQGTVQSASGVIMPLNSKPQNLHHHYGNHEPYFQKISESSNLRVELRQGGSGEYRVYEGNTLIYTYDPVAQSGRQI